jgi:hypothetical protein
VDSDVRGLSGVATFGVRTGPGNDIILRATQPFPAKEDVMRSAHWSLRFALGMMLTLGLMAFSAFQAPQPASAAATTAKITLHVIECPATTTNLFATCHDSNRLSGASFTVAGVTRASDGSGVVSWGPSAGSKTITMDAADFAVYGKAWIYCKDQVSGVVQFDGRNTTGSVTIATTAGQLTICDWYNLT